MKKLLLIAALAVMALAGCKKSPAEENEKAPVVVTAAAADVTATSATLGGNITNAGTPAYTERGVCCSTSQNPTTGSGKTAVAGTGTGGFSAEVTGLAPNTTYYVRAYATNSSGTAYGSEVSFTTLQAEALPVLTTSAVTNIATTSATMGGNITNAGTPAYTERGVCCSTSQNPTTGSGKTAVAGTGTGSFSAEVTGLAPNTTYYVRAYATNSSGTAYGEQVSFTTLISAQPEANCYMVAPNSEAIYIPVSQANRVNTSDGLGAVTEGLGGVTADNYTVELVWGDTPVGASGVIKKLEAYAQDGKGYVRVEPGAAGNAVVCIKDKTSGAVKWSWHIWVTGTVGSKKDTETGLTWMDRNLGAAGTTWNTSGKNGLYYQWGRKDAFPASDGTNNNQTYYTGSNTTGTTAALPTGEYTELPGLVQNPLNFATNDGTYRGSVNADGDNDSWGGTSGKKTIYDPCPAGWKVPPIKVGTVNSWGSYTEVDNNEWTFINYIGTNKGAIFNGANGGTSALGHFYPATGNRSYNSGAFYNMDFNCYWTGAVTDIYGRSLYFRATNVYPVDNTHRTYGFPVRCVAE